VASGDAVLEWTFRLAGALIARPAGEPPLRPLANVGDSRKKSAMSAKYDSIGKNYSELRKPDRRIARIIESALGSAQTVLNVGAGTGSYEPTDRSVIAVEPSREMIRKRSGGGRGDSGQRRGSAIR
jgi:hypothetical protein